MDMDQEAPLLRMPNMDPQTVACRRLLAAMLHQAVLDLVNAKAMRIRATEIELELWFKEDDPKAGCKTGLSFPWVCEQLDIAHDQFREKLFRKWKHVALRPDATAMRKGLRKFHHGEQPIKSEAGLRQSLQREARGSEEAFHEESSAETV